MTEGVHFLPWLRRGLAGFETGATSGGTLALSAQVEARGLDADATETRVVTTPTAQIIGPGAVEMINPAQVIRKEPSPDSTEIEPNYFACIELAAPDLPWRFTLGPPNAEGHLMPWIALVVVEDRQGVSVTAQPGTRAARLDIDDAGTELPNLAEAWSWAHVQIEAGLDGSEADGPKIKAELESPTGKARARLFCPRRLDPNCRYTACLVPITQAGRLAGLGSPGSTDLAPAWDETTSEITLPVFAHWRFTTGQRGDFESLVSRLQPQAVPGSLGQRSVRIHESTAKALNSTADEPLTYTGALVSPQVAEKLTEMEGKAPDDNSQAMRVALAELLSSKLGDATKESDPVVGLPLYGQRHWKPMTEAFDSADPAWFASVNTHLEHRMTAGLAADVVRDNQERLMDEAWDLAKEAQRANAQLNATQLANEVGNVAQARWSDLQTGRRVQIAGPALPAMVASGNRSIQAQIHASAVPNGLISGAARRVMRPANGLGQDMGALNVGTEAVEQFLSNPLGEIGAFRDVLAPLGQNGAATDAPQLENLPSGETVVALSWPSTQRRPRQAFQQNPGVDGLFNSLTEAQNTRALLERSVTSRLSGLSEQGESLPKQATFTLGFRTPAFQMLRDKNVELLVPGIGGLATDSVSMLVSNAHFVNSYLIGLNHEMGRELLWREYPATPQATPFRHFWSPVIADVPPLQELGSEPLTQSYRENESGPSLAVIVRGALPRRYPDLRLYAVPAMWSTFKNLDGNTVWYRKEDQTADAIPPDFVGSLGDDTFFFGLPLSVSDARGTLDHNSPAGYFLVFEETPTAPRFGLEVAKEDEAFGLPPDDWQMITWGDVTPAGRDTPVRFLSLDAVSWMDDGIARPITETESDIWARDAASFGRQMMQRPVRMLVHASAMLPA